VKTLVLELLEGPTLANQIAQVVRQTPRLLTLWEDAKPRANAR
jgi:hypothetical protein